MKTLGFIIIQPTGNEVEGDPTFLLHSNTYNTNNNTFPLFWRLLVVGMAQGSEEERSYILRASALQILFGTLSKENKDIIIKFPI